MGESSMAAPVYSFEDGQWVSSVEAIGAYGNLYGGAVAGVMAAAIMREFPDLRERVCVTFSARMLRPSTNKPMKVSVKSIQKGARLALIEAEMSQREGKLTAKASALFMTENDLPDMAPGLLGDHTAVKPIEGLVPPPGGKQPVHQAAESRQLMDMQAGKLENPSVPTAPPGTGPQGTAHFYGIELREDEEREIVWMRLNQPFVADAAPLVRMVLLSDWASGMARASGPHPQVPAFRIPNVDLGLHFARPIHGEWLGVKPTRYWYPTGLGQTDTELYDEAGILGRATQSMAFARF